MSKDFTQQKLKYAVFTLARYAENRRCADCNASLDEGEDGTFASMEFGVWICQACRVTHELFLGANFSRIKSINEKWTREEVDVMKNAGNNVKRNEILERYVPDLLTKINPDASDYDREIWIRAKYFSKLFMIPHYNVSLKKAQQSTPAQELLELPTRLVDYFITLGPSRVKSTAGIRARSNTISAVKTSKSSGFVPEDLLFKPVIDSCFPEPGYYKNMPVPDLIAQFAFPIGLTLSSVLLPPQFFTLVLTDISRVKLYAAVLVVYEIQEPESVQELQCLGKDDEFLPTYAGSVFAPKALLVLSHYPFYNLFKVFLEQIYRLSLSSSPIPIERYISNFMLEVPLPPDGEVEVVFNLGDQIVHLTRPPPNQMPMVDFSYRPLFTALSTDSIITLFRCLCSEVPVCVYSSKLAVLTPVQEALLSFLFPFVWQGVFIPILDSNLKDIIEAPVPFLVGLHTNLVAEIVQPEGVVFVDIDNDSFFFNSHLMIMSNDRNELLSQLPIISKQNYTKLKEKLDEFGGVLFRTSSMRSIGNPFPNNEYTPAPISDTLLKDVGVAQRKVSAVPRSKITVSGIAGSSAAGTTPEAADGAPLACTLTYPRAKTKDSEFDRLSLDRDAINAHRVSSNLSNGSQTNLQALLQGAMFSQQAGNQKVGSGHNSSGHNNSGHANPPVGSNSIIAPSSSKAKFKHSLLDSINNCNYDDKFNAREIRYAFLRYFVGGMMTYQEALNPSKPNGFDFDKFITKETDPLMKTLVRTQMFSNFLDERISNPNLPEILFFDENILAKLNRSKLQLKKKPTPFLSNTSFLINEAFSCSAPSTWGIPQRQKYSYSSFPVLNKELFGSPRESAVLVKAPQRRRADKGYEESINLIAGMHEKIIKLMNDASNVDVYDDIEVWIAMSYQRFQNVERVLLKIQYLFRRFKFIRALKTFRNATLRLQCAMRCYFARTKLTVLKGLSFAKDSVPQIIVIQSFIRMSNAVCRYSFILHSILRIQSLIRKHLQVLRYRAYRRKVILVQSRVVGWLVRKKFGANLLGLIAARKALVVWLWLLAHSPLCYRAVFWREAHKKRRPLVTLAIWNSELDRMCSELELFSLANFQESNKRKLTAEMKYDMVVKHAIVHQLRSEVPAIAAQLRDTSTALKTSLLQNIVSKLPKGAQDRIHNMVTQEMAERELYYSILKGSQDNTTKNSLFNRMKIASPKKRKQKLCNVLWMIDNISDDNVTQSMEAIFSILELAAKLQLTPQQSSYLSALRRVCTVEATSAMRRSIADSNVHVAKALFRVLCDREKRLSVGR